MSTLPGIKVRIEDAFELVAGMGAGQVARLLIGGFTPAASVIAGPIIFVVDKIAQELISKIATLCFKNNINLQGKIKEYAFIFAKPITFVVTLLAFMAIGALFGATYPLVNLIAAVSILSTGLFATQVTIKVIQSVFGQCTAKCA